MAALPLLAALFAAAVSAAPTPTAQAPSRAERPRIDVAFTLDTTGSMGDEIDVVKARIVEIARKVSAGQPRPDVRYAIVAYRDRGDAYLTKVFPFTREIADVEKALRSLDADGGGDEPEAVAEALFVTVHELAWDKSEKVTRMAFLIGDAGPQQYADGKDWRKVSAEAAEAGITVHAIGCSGLNPTAEKQFAEIARRTHGELAHLTYKAGRVMSADGRARTLLKSGDKAYVAEKELSASEWKKGADALVAEGKLRAARAEEVAAAAPPPVGLAARAGLASSARVRGAGAAETEAAVDDGNNLDAEIAGRIQAAAKAKGTTYVAK